VEWKALVAQRIEQRSPNAQIEVQFPSRVQFVILILMKRSEIFKFLILRTIGNFLVLFAVFGILATFGPALYYEVSLKIVQVRGIKYVVAEAPVPTPAPNPALTNLVRQPQVSPIPTPVKSIGVDNFAQVLTGPKQQILVPVDTQFSIVIPKIGASAKVYPNVNPASPDAFLPILKNGVAHAKGTVFPGMNGNVYLFAHSTDNFWDVGRYNALFYLIKDLSKGDEVSIFFENKRHNYVVTGSKIVGSSDVSYIVNARNQTQEQLVLQTCWPPGTTFQRLLVFAEPK
jgi:LPXTG-site transpeptidase (sortase) family protein